MAAMTGNAIREALEPFAKEAEDWLDTIPDHVQMSAFNITLGDLRRARTAYDAIGSGVKALEWRDSGAGNHSSAHSDLGLYVVSQTRSGNFRVFVLWIDPGGNDADREICEAGSLLEAKAAAQADFERRVLSCLSTHTATGAGLVRDATDAMIEAGLKVDMTNEDERGYLHNVWYAMVAAHPAGAGPVGEVERARSDPEFWKGRFQVETAARIAAEAALAETRERLEKLLAAVGKARTALAGFTSADDAAFAIDVVVGEVADWKRRAALTGDAQEASPMEKLGKFGWHPDPVIDFEVEIEKLESRFDCAMRGTSKPGEQPETVQAVYDDIRRAMTFRAGGTVEGVVAKNRLRELEKKALAAPAGDAHEAGR